MNVNFLAVILAAIANMAIGFVWYMPKVMGTLWMKASGKMPGEGQTNMGPVFTLQTIGAVVYAYVLATALKMAAPANIGAAIEFALLLWLGFYMACTLGDFLFTGRSKKLYLINGGYYFIIAIVNTIILFAIK